MRAVLAMIVIAASLLATSQPASADRRGSGLLGLDTQLLNPGREARDRDERPRDGMSPNEAAKRAQRENGGGRVLSVEPSGDGYRVKLLRDGEVRIVHVQ
eukprot:TRINITY_DN4528_c0_g1_i2.p1 TRINITY_DN4528_c0_g1~~TRINITY_DN4528_c0_g1_i2.p1  ORF type:complete len:100 (+),score=25.46 TRINITY_DN4528_c0_g1_i2:333-632(+)